MVPVAFKMGIMSSLIFLLVLIALKNLVIGKTILLINAGFVLFKIIAFFSKLKGYGHWGGGGGGHYPYYSAGGHGTAGWDPQKNIHIHLHNSGGWAEKTPITEYAGTLPLTYPTSQHQSTY